MDAWVTVHTVFLLFIPLLAIAAYVLLRDLTGRAAIVSRVALVFFVCFYTAYEVTVGLGSALIAIHPPPVGPVALAFFAAAAVLDKRRRAGSEVRPRCRRQRPRRSSCRHR